MKRRPTILAIAGGTGSGKSHLARTIAAGVPFGCAVLSQDCYYHDRSHVTPEEELLLNFDSPDAFDIDLLCGDLARLLSGTPIQPPRYDYRIHGRTGHLEHVTPAPLLILEGVLVLHEERLRAFFDYSVFVEVCQELRLTRRIQRDARERGIAEEETRRLYAQSVSEMHARFVQPSSAHASVVWRQESDPEFPERLCKHLVSLVEARA